MALNLLPERAAVLDFDAGTGIDAKAYAANGHPTFVYEPSKAMCEYLAQYCRDEIARKTIITVASPLTCKVQAVTANFATFNHNDAQIGWFNINRDSLRFFHPVRVCRRIWREKIAG
ncbi:MAG: hypothetical protein ABI227_03465 [Rhodanobacter sp.]